MRPPKRILVPTDFSDCAKEALLQAIDLAVAAGAEIVLLHVVAPLPHPARQVLENLHRLKLGDALLKDAKARLEELAATVVEGKAHIRILLREGTPSEQIRGAAEDEAADLIVIGTQGYGGVKKLFLGSTAERVTRSAPCSVFLVRGRS